MTEQEIAEQETTEEKGLAVRAGEKVGYFLALSLVALILFLIYKAVSWGYNAVYPFYGNVDRVALHSTLTIAIENDADLEAIKTIFRNRKVDTGIYARWLTSSQDAYSEPVNLSGVFRDMRADYFLRDEGDPAYLAKLDALLNEHEEVNPFDRLQPHQRDSFSNIRIKLGQEYGKIDSDLTKISEELNKQNELVKEYLSDATTSLAISITGLLFALLVSVIQIFQNKRRGKTEHNRHLQILSSLVRGSDA